MFPSTTSITVGPGFRSLLPGYPENKNSPICASNFENRKLTEIDEVLLNTESSPTAVNIGKFRGHDYFGDGSFYLLDTPGHAVGHLCGLARVTPSTFILMGGDICHCLAAVRPSENMPMPDPIPEGVLDISPRFPIPCPAAAFTDLHPRFHSNVPNNNRRDDGAQSPWYKVSTHAKSAYSDPATAQESVDKLQAFDDSPNVLLCIAHDPSLLRYLPTFNEHGLQGDGLKDWKEKGLKEKVHWDWLNDLPRDGKEGRKPIVEGFWKDGKPFDRGHDGKGAKF